MALKVKTSHEDLLLNNSGIYEIRNKINNSIYIGSSSNLRVRINGHNSALGRGKHHSIYLQRAWNKYGSDSFVLSVLLYCEKFELLRYEQLLVDALKPKYNICKLAVSTRKGTKQSAEAKNKISLSLMGNKRTLGRKRRAEEIESMARTMAGRKPHINTMIALTKRAKHWGNIMSPNGKLYEDVINLRKFCKKHSLSYGDMWQVCNGVRLQHNGWKKCP